MSKRLFANFKLEKNFKKRWVAALRSGKYEQAQGELFDGEGYCCLGVMCALRGATKKEMQGHPFPNDLHNFAKVFNLDDATANYFDTNGGEAWQVPYRGEMVELADLNDGQRLSFNKIALIIERSVQTY